MRAHHVKRGETTSQIAALHGVSNEDLVAANPHKRSREHAGRVVFAELREGEMLAVGVGEDPAKSGALYYNQAAYEQQKQCGPGTVYVQLTPYEGGCALDTSTWPVGAPLPQGPCPTGHVPMQMTSGPVAGQYRCVNAQYPGMPRPGSAPNVPPTTPAPTTVPGWPPIDQIVAGLPGLPSTLPQLPALDVAFPAIPQVPVVFAASGPGIDPASGLPLPGVIPATTPAGQAPIDPRYLANGAIPCGQYNQGTPGFMPAPAPKPACEWIEKGAFTIDIDGCTYCAVCDEPGWIYNPATKQCDIPQTPEPGDKGGGDKGGGDKGGGDVKTSQPEPEKGWSTGAKVGVVVAVAAVVAGAFMLGRKR